MSETWYRASPNIFVTARIEQVEAVKSSDKYVWIGKRKNAKMDKYSAYFKTWNEAYEYLREWTANDVDTALHNLELSRSRFADVLKLTPPAADTQRRDG